MHLAQIDWLVLAAYGLLTIGVGLLAARRAGQGAAEFFLSGRSAPWWLLGISMVATTFSTDTPNLVADITRRNGVAGNWVWWAFLLTGMTTTFVYAGLWRRSGVLTDLEFYEIRYSGRPAAFLRGFRALYLGVLFNVLVMASVTLAAIKIAGVLFGWSPFATVMVASVVTVIVSTAGGLRSVLYTDLLLFAAAMTGSVAAAFFSLRHPQVGGLSGLLAHSAVKDRLDLLPDFGDPAVAVPLFIVPLAVQWWAAWYPGSEPGGGGYVAQRILAARSEMHATGATLFFNLAHYALRPWPWLLVALASLIVFPDLAALHAAFPEVAPNVLGHDLAYPAMLTFVPAGWLGLVVGSLSAAYVSTISTHLNWGASYLANDLYRRFLQPEASERRVVLVGRLATIGLMALAALLALHLENALQAFGLLLQIGAGTGLLFLLRWFWWRINAWAEIAAMAVSFAVAAFFLLRPDGAVGGGFEPWQELLIGVAVTTVAWVSAAFCTRPTAESVLRSFYRKTRPGGPGWRAVVKRANKEGDFLASDGEDWEVPRGALCMLTATVTVYSVLFATGLGLYGRYAPALALALLAVVGGVTTFRLWWPSQRQRLTKSEGREEGQS
jgi:Na+/proline symporter